MKTILPILLLLFCVSLTAQDTIFVKDGQVIPAFIIEKNSSEIKYRKPSNSESNAIYSVFTSDILSIHYKDGIIADYSGTNQENEKKEQTALDMAGSARTIRFSIGLSPELFTAYTWDNFLPTWRYYTGNSQATIQGNSFAVPVTIKMVSALGALARHWFGDEIRLRRYGNVLHASDGTGSNELRMNEFVATIIIVYGHVLDHKKNLLACIELGADLSLGLKGSLKLGGKQFRNLSTTGVDVPHVALGLDYNIGKRLLISGRAGYRIKRTEEVEYYNSNTDWNYFKPYSSGGPYGTFGLSYNFYVKSPFGKTTK